MNMTKTKQLLFALAAVAMMGTEASAANIGYTNGQCGRSYMFRRGTTTTQGMAIRLNKEKLQLLKGKTISSVDFATGSVQTTGKTVDVFITTDIRGDLTDHIPYFIVIQILFTVNAQIGIIGSLILGEIFPDQGFGNFSTVGDMSIADIEL